HGALPIFVADVAVGVDGPRTAAGARPVHVGLGSDGGDDHPAGADPDAAARFHHRAVAAGEMHPPVRPHRHRAGSAADGHVAAAAGLADAGAARELDIAVGMYRADLDVAADGHVAGGAQGVDAGDRGTVEPRVAIDVDDRVVRAPELDAAGQVQVAVDVHRVDHAAATRRRRAGPAAV